VGVLLRGSISVLCNVGTPFAAGPAYLRSILNGGIPAGFVGGIEANADGVNSGIINGINGLPDAYFKNGVIDANKIVELTFINRMAP
jgi:hypothetical protein